MRKIVITVLAAIVLGGCSIKEDRGDCPAWLHLALSARSLAIAGELPVFVMVENGGRVDSLKLDASVPDAWMPVVRGNLLIEGLLDNGAGLSVAWGGECDSLWATAASLRLTAEEGLAEVNLHKRFATVHFVFDPELETEESRLVLRSDISGTDLTRMNPVSGDFRCILFPFRGEASVRLPAHRKDSPISLSCVSLSDGRERWRWDLADALRRAGYDWEAEDLADVRVYVTLTPIEMGVEILPWVCGDELGIGI